MIQKDEHIDLSGFLEGSPDAPLHWREVDLRSDLRPEEWRSIEAYQLRAREFLLNVKDLGLRSLWSLDINSGGPKTKVAASIYPGRHRAKSLYLDFRHFLAHKEPSKFQRVIKALRRNLDNQDPIQVFLAQLKDKFIEDQNFGIKVSGRNFPMNTLIEIWFNTEFFHAGTQVQLELRQELLKALEEDSAHHLLLWAVVNAAHPVKCLYACVKDMSRDGGLKANCPDPRIILGRENLSGRRDRRA